MKKEDEGNKLNSLFSNRELNFFEREERSQEIVFYLANQGGLILAISCKDGILLTGISPANEKTVFQVFHRIGLLGAGKDSDCEAIHKIAQALALGTSLRFSKADIKAQDIAKRIAQELDQSFSYLHGRRGFSQPDPSNPIWPKVGPYKANFIIAELGFDAKEDFLDLISFYGDRSHAREISRSLWAVIELPRIVENITYVNVPIISVKKPVENKDSEIKNGDNKEKDKIETQKVPIRMPEVDYNYHPVMDGLCPIIVKFYSHDRIWTIEEAALLVGLAIRILDERDGYLEMAYLDRAMLQKSKTEERQFHHIWKWITNPREISYAWQDWRKFVASAYNKLKKGELYPELKFLIEIYEGLKKIGFDKKDELKKMKKQELAKLIVHLLENKPQGN